ncbi:MFS transporter [Actinocatenispora rupis]|uniref:MFS transporter n=1 Tax=Actinocatenispora rupis TaxID=519421 RepID=A0A8J3ND84_9ACTN|nr:MFS transporter [Actinocatenispora rupis]GID15094.1 MFS transporter [Actinocatenispora rupis]
MSHTAVAAEPKAASPTAPPVAGGAMSHRQIMAILIGLMLGMFLAALDQTIVGTAIRTIADDLHGLDQQAWATTAYLITSTIATPLYGKLSDMYGRKPFFLAAIVIFIVGSIACTFATSMYELAAFRAFQGLGGGGLMALAFAIIGDIVSPRERAKYQGYFLAVFGTSSVLGPVLGGFFAGQGSILGIDGWRWVFLVNVPIAVIAMIVVTKVLNVPHAARRHRIDFPGAATLIVGLVPLLIVAEQGREWGWSSTRSIGCYVIGGVGILLFILAEKWAKDDALIPLRLFRNPVIALMSVSGLVVGMAMFGGIAILPQYLQIVHGASPTKSGFLMLPMVGGMMLGSIVSGQITSRTGRYKIFPIIGTAMMIGALFLLHYIGADTPLWQVDIYMGLLGLGLGNCMQTLTLAVQNAAEPKDMGVASASSTFFRSMGGTLGTAVFLSVLFSTVGDKIGNAFKQKSIQQGIAEVAAGAKRGDPSIVHNKDTMWMLQHPKEAASQVMQDSSFLSRIDGRLARPFLVGFSNSMDLVFLLAAGVAVIAFILFLFTKEVPLRMQSGIAAQASSEAAKSAPAAAAAESAEGGRHAAPAAAEAPVDAVPPEPLAEPPLPGPVTPLIGTPIRGYVRQQGGSPVGAAALTLIDPAGSQIGRGQSAEDGTYQIAVEHPGNYVLIARARAHQPQATMVSVNGNPVDLDLLLAGSGGLVGAVRRTGGKAIAGATVILADAEGQVIGSKGTDVAGQYEFGELVAGSYTLAVSAPSYQPLALLVSVPETGRVRQDVELSGGAQLRGTARSKDQRPIADARVSLRTPEGREIASTTTDDAGRYAFTEVPEGDYVIVSSGYAPVESKLSLTVGERYEHDVRLSHDY